MRVIHNQNLFLVEGGLGLYLRRNNSPTDGYRLAAAYCEHYDPRYGTGFNGPSAVRIEEIADFVLAIEITSRQVRNYLSSKREGECPENGGMTTQGVRSVGSIADRGNGDAMGVAVDCDGG